MNSWPTLKQWLAFGGAISLQLLLLFAVAKLISLRLHSAQWRRCLWQVVMVATLLVVGGELSGVREMIRLPQPPPKTEKAIPQTRAVVVTIKDAEIPMAAAPAVSFEPSSDATLASTQPVSPWQQRASWPALLWLAVTALLLGRMFLGQILSLSFRVSARHHHVGAELQSRTAHLADVMRIRRRVTLVNSLKAAVPFTFGIWRPVIVLPAHFTETFTPEQQDAALTHELAHVAGGDSAWRALSNFTCSLLWWNPFAWLAKRELDHASELVADESSLLLANGPSSLAECLVACAKKIHAPTAISWLGMDGGGFRSALGKRVSRLLQLNPRHGPTVRVPWYVRILLPMVCAVGLWFAMAFVTGNSTAPSQNPWRDSLVGSALAALAEPAKADLPEGVEGAQPNREATPVPADAPSALHTRFFKVDPATVLQSLTNVRAFSFHEKASHGGMRRQREDKAIDFLKEVETAELLPAIRKFFVVAGVDLTSPGKAIFFNDRLGMLMVRATLQDLDIVEKALQMLNINPPQLEIRVKVMEVPVENSRSALLPYGLTNPPRSADALMDNSLLSVTNGFRTTNRPSPTVTGILTDEQFRKLIADLEKSGGADLLSAPAVTTMSGRQAQIKVVDIRYIVTDIDYSTNGLPAASPPEPMPIAEPFELGPVVDIVPHVEADGYTIQMTVLPTLREFLGYEDPKTIWAAGGPLAPPEPRQPTPLPKFRLRQVASTARVWDGQTLVLGAGQSRTMQKDRDDNGIITTNYLDKDLFFFITPRLVDAAGNPLHSDEELGQRTGVPEQPRKQPVNEYE